MAGLKKYFLNSCYRILCGSLFLMAAIPFYSQGYKLSYETEIVLETDMKTAMETMIPGNIFRLAVHKDKLYILYDDHKDEHNQQFEIWACNEDGSKLGKHPVIIPDSIREIYYPQGFDISEKYFCFADASHIYIGKNNLVNGAYIVSRCLPNSFESNSLSTNFHLSGDTLFFSSYDQSNQNPVYKSFFIKYHIPENRFFDKIPNEITNIFCDGYNSTYPLDAGNKWVAYSEPFEYRIKVLANRLLQADTQLLTREDSAYFWMPVPAEKNALFRNNLNTAERINAKLKLAAHHVFHFSSINRLKFISDSVLIVRHSHPHLKVGYIDIWKITYPQPVLLKKNVLFTGDMLLYNEQKENYTFLPQVFTGNVNYAKDNQLWILSGNAYKKNKKNNVLIIQKFDFSEAAKTSPEQK